mgnify:FL=1
MENYRINKLHGILLEDDRVPQLQEKVNELEDKGGEGSIIILEPNKPVHFEDLIKASAIYYKQTLSVAGESATIILPCRVAFLDSILALYITMLPMNTGAVECEGEIRYLITEDDTDMFTVYYMDSDNNLFITDTGDSTCLICPTKTVIVDETTSFTKSDIELLNNASTVHLPINNVKSTIVMKFDATQVLICTMSLNEVQYMTLTIGKTFAECKENTTTYTLTPKA